MSCFPQKKNFILWIYLSSLLSEFTKFLWWKVFKIFNFSKMTNILRDGFFLSRSNNPTKVWNSFILKGKQNIALEHSVQFSRSVMSNSLQPHESQLSRPPCPSPTSGAHSDSRPSSQWCHPAISSSVVPFSSCPQSLPASESFPMSQLFAWGVQTTGASALASFLPKKSQAWSPSEWTG